MSKISHFTAVGLLVAAGYSLSLGTEGRAQIAGMSEVVAVSVVGAIDEAKRLSSELAAATSHLSFANVYSTVGVLIGAVEHVGSAQPAAVSQVLVVTDSEEEISDADVKAGIQSSFSDTVKVVPDATKKSGTIIPVFRGVEGEKYLYVAVPVKK